jgi:hypothetical protein
LWLSPESDRPNIRRILLGWFIVWQLVFLGASSSLAFWFSTHPAPTLKEAERSSLGKVGVVSNVAAGVLDLTKHWSALTGQWEGWSLYGPHVPTHSTFLAVELVWDGEPARDPVLLTSDFEPRDRLQYFRPFGSARLSNYEAYLSLVLWGWDHEAAAKKPEPWRQRLAEHIRKECRHILAYLRRKLASFQREHPATTTPTEVILKGRLYSIAPPGQRPWSWPSPTEVPVARWQPQRAISEGCLPLESYNPGTGRFDLLPVRAGPTDE